MNQLTENAFVGTEAVCGVEAAQAGAAEGAAAVLVERKSVHKGNAAADAEKLGGEGLGRAQACAANRDAGDFREGFPAYAAIVGEEEGKKGVRGCPN